MPLIIKSGTIITAADTFKADILVEGEQIRLIARDLAVEGAEVHDATGKLVMPGGVDPHVHLNLPMFGTVSSDDHYTGLKAAAFGGTTSVLDFVPMDEETIPASIEAWHKRADAIAAVDFGFHMNITRFNGQVRQEITQLRNLGITSMKVFTAYNNRLRLQDGEIFQVLRLASKQHLTTMLHAEDGDVIDILVSEALAQGHTEPVWHARTRPAWGAVEAVARATALSAQADAPLYIVHMNVAGEVDHLHYARKHGLKVMGETCPQYLFFSMDLLEHEDGAKWVCSPPLRTSADNKRLWQGLTDGTLQTVGTDHCPFFYDGSKAIQYEGKPIAIPGKELGKDDFTKIPNGLPGIGDRLPVMWTYGVRSGKLSTNQFVALMSTNPAKIFGMYPRKGTLMPGSDADIIIWDPDKRIRYGLGYAHHRTDYNLYENWELVGMPEKVFLRGHLIVNGDQWLGKAGMGKFISRSLGTTL